ncbi:MAG: carbon storage regulator [Elusimicrobia bacterium]|jgi:carbon storage regulator|nr:carbon storage regulator [Elusimicrobiota bacterium]
MLLLTRRLEESVLIGGTIVVKVLSIARGQVTLGISAPTTVPVHRQEVHDAIKALNRHAANAFPSDLDKATHAIPTTVPPKK